MDVNQVIRTAAGGRCSELDLALMKRYVDCARVLVRARCVAHALCGSMCDELFHRFVLMGDGVGAELLLAEVRCALRGGQLPLYAR